MEAPLSGRQSWIIDSLGSEAIENASTDAGRRRLYGALEVSGKPRVDEERLDFIASGLELQVLDLLDGDDSDRLTVAAAEAFQIARVLSIPDGLVESAEAIVRVGSLGVIGDRGADVQRYLLGKNLVPSDLEDLDWGVRVWVSVLDIWMRIFRKSGWADLDEVAASVAFLRREQANSEPHFLSESAERSDPAPAWRLVAEYHVARAAELLAVFFSQGSVDGHFDIREQLEAQFDRALSAAGRGHSIGHEVLIRLLARAARKLVDNSIWTVTRAVNSRVTKFVSSLVSRERKRPMFEMLPPQRRALREQGLLGSAHRAVVVSLPTSSGKTLVAEFRILQALNQFDRERGWIAYLAPTRALVNQLTMRLRRDFADLEVVVEKVSPALEVDGLEAEMLVDGDVTRQFRVLVTTPEKLDLMLRGGWEQKIGRPLTLVVVDEAHGLASAGRGLRLELLLATINRECRHAQFLLLTPFVPNVGEIARWLSPDSHNSIELGLDWSPNDRLIAIATPRRQEDRSGFTISLDPQHTTRNTISVPESLEITENRPLGLTYSAVSKGAGKLAAATAHILQKRGTVIVLVDKPRNSWGVAESFKIPEYQISSTDNDVEFIRSFLADEMGPEFPLVSLLEYGIGVHHAGLSEDTRMLMEWLAEKSKLRVLIATTTLAQGVNFPVSGVVFASHQYPYGVDMPPEDFWNIAGRAGRVDQGDLGVVALAATSDDKGRKLREFVARNVETLNSTLIGMVQQAAEQGSLLQLSALAWQPAWSSFLQYLAHTYRQIGDHEQFAAQVEQVLRGTLGFQTLRRTNRSWADQLVQGVFNYAERLQGQPLKLVDATGFSWETVAGTLARLSEERVSSDVWSPDLFSRKRRDLQRLMGILLEVPELRDSLAEVTGGTRPDGDLLARIVSDWVQGRPLPEMAADYFAKSRTGDNDGVGSERDPVTSLTKCCQSVFGRLTQTASWGLAALQSLTVGDRIDLLSSEEQLTMRNLPARVYYGVNSDEAVTMRLVGVPRYAAPDLAKSMGITRSDKVHEVRAKLRSTGVELWRQALGPRGDSYHRVWSMLEGTI